MSPLRDRSAARRCCLVFLGASFGGLAALLGMLNTCSPNVCTVNIDNGFGAACIATLINRM